MTVSRPTNASGAQNTRTIRNALASVMFAAASLTAISASAVDVKVQLSGEQESPPVKTIGVGSAFFAISNDRKVSGQVNVVNIKPVAVHVHEGAPGVSGPIVFPLVRSGETSYTVPPNVQLSEAQMAAFQAGKLYVNVHTEKHPGGELRGQLKP